MNRSVFFRSSLAAIAGALLAPIATGADQVPTVVSAPAFNDANYRTSPLTVDSVRLMARRICDARWMSFEELARNQ